MQARTAEALMPRRARSHQDPALVAPGDRDLGARLMSFSTRTSELATPNDVLDALNTATSQSHPLQVLSAARFPLKVGDWTALKLGETVFLHKDVPRGWWQEYSNHGQRAYDPGIMMARIGLAPYTWTESRRMIEPIGVDRWPMDLALKYGMRDGLTCPVGGRWVLAYCSRKVLSSDVLSAEARVMIFTASCYAIMRIEALLGPDPGRFPVRAQLTARERAVLQMAAAGRDIKAIAAALRLGEETIRTHLRKAKEKLGASNRTQAVAEAIRQHLFP